MAQSAATATTVAAVVPTGATAALRPIGATDIRLSVDAVRGCVALERGPLVYAIESEDPPAGIELEDIAIPDGAVPRDATRPAIAPSSVGLAIEATAAGTPIELAAIPYFAWANRGVGGMRVWIPRAAP